MVDFSKLRDPVWQEKVRKEREAEEAAREAHDKMLRDAVDVCLTAHESLAEGERSLVRNCRTRLNTYLSLSEKQEKWLLDITKRVREELAEKTSELIDLCADGDPAGEHPTYTRSTWPSAGDATVDASAYWVWVLGQIEFNGGNGEHCSECSAQLDGNGWDGKCGDCVDSEGDDPDDEDGADD